MKKNIILIGMPGVGKSTAGVVLAKAIGYHFIDADLKIQEQEGKLLCELIQELGPDGFLKLENQVNRDMQVERTIIATGGSAVYGQEAMEHYKETGIIVYLKISYEELEKRLGDLTNRGVVLKDGQTLLDLYQERICLYEKYADITIDEDGLSIRETIDEVTRQLAGRI